MPFSQTPPWGGARGRWGGAGPAWCVQLLYPPSRPPWVMVPWSLSPGQRTEMPMTQTVSNRQSTERGFCSQAHPLRLGNGSCTPTYLTPLSSRWTPPHQNEVPRRWVTAFPSLPSWPSPQHPLPQRSKGCGFRAPRNPGTGCSSPMPLDAKGSP